MKALLKKEFLQLKSLWKNYLFSVLMFSVIGVFTKNIMFVNMSTIILPISVVLSAFAFDGQSNWDSFALTMPLKREDLVKSKYILYLIILLGLGLFANIINFTLIYPRSDFELGEIFISYYAVFIMINLMAAIQIPIIVKKGVEKARNSMMIIYFLIFGSIGGLTYLIKDSINIEVIELFFKTNGIILLMVSLIIQVLFFIVSYKISQNFIKNKDF